MNFGSLTFQLLIPAAVWWGLACAGAAAIVWYAQRRPPGVTPLRWGGILSLMTLSLLLVLAVLLNPTWIQPMPAPGGKPQLTLLVDATESMATQDGGEGRTRFQSAAQRAQSLAGTLGNAFDVRLRMFMDAPTSVDAAALSQLKPLGRSTDLATALQDSLDGDRQRGQAVVLLSDGIHNVGGGVDRIFDALRLAKSMDTPVFTQTFGGAGQVVDLAVELRTPQDLAFVGQRVPVTARIHHPGLDRGTAHVLLLEGGKQVQDQQVTLTRDAAGEARFWIQRDKVGVYPYEVRVAALPGETSQTNNIASYMLRVIDHPIHVLLLEGKPYWDAKFLIRTLSAVPAVELESVVRLTDQRLVRRTWKREAATATAPAQPPAAAPTSRHEQDWTIATSATSFLADPATLRNYQVIVLGRDAEAFLNETCITNLQHWIARDGGSLVCSCGEPAAPLDQRLARLLPVHWERAADSRFHMVLTDQGREMNWLPEATDQAPLSAMPALASNTHIDRTGPLAVVLATTITPTGQVTPAVVYQPYGTGRVVVMEGAGMWRWAFLPPQFQDREETYDTLWHSMLRWIASGVALMPGQKMTLRVDKISFETGEAATASVLIRSDTGHEQPPDVQLTSVDLGTIQNFTPAPFGNQPGTFRVSFGKLPEGRYAVRLLGPDLNDPSLRSVFDVRNVSAEQLDLDARPDLMARIAHDTGGITLTEQTSPDELRKAFLHYRDADRPPQMIRHTAWDRWWVFAGLIAVWALAWGLRRSGGLV